MGYFFQDLNKIKLYYGKGFTGESYLFAPNIIYSDINRNGVH